MYYPRVTHSSFDPVKIFVDTSTLSEVLHGALDWWIPAPLDFQADRTASVYLSGFSI